MTDTVDGREGADTEGPAPDATPQQDPEKASPYAWYVLSVLVVIYILNFIDRQILAILAEDIKADLGIDDAALGFLYGTAFAVFYGLFGIPLGKLADSWHRVKLMTAGLALWSAMTALSGFAKSFTVLSIARIGVGVGEASASPSAYSLISDYFPKKMRATALAIYSSGLYLGGGVSLLIGGLIVERWNAAYPVDAPLGLAGWQAAFLIVGLPGLLLAILVYTLREPLRGEAEGLPTPPPPNPFRGFFRELYAIIPPFTLIAAAQRGPRALMINIGAALVAAIIAYFMVAITGNLPQWIAIGVGYYAIFSWAVSLRRNDPPAFALIWGSPAFMTTILGYGTVAFVAYAVGFWTAPYAMRELGESPSMVGLLVGGPAAAAGFLGVILGGRMADWLRQRSAAGRIYVVLFGLLAPVIPLIIAFTTSSLIVFYVLSFVISLFASTALGAAAATTQDLVLPRMRGTATATFFLSTTLIGLALGPYLAGQVSTATGSLTTGVLSLLVAVPIGALLLLIAIRTVPEAERTVVERAKAAGETI
ncbi:MAG: spinster family MFS transporter [Parasphingopyxis sp.]|uniref:spinster family MFS transporter n=1 Tax=Parasphingopyxis sp. TaxID=1920299 RepID=UPI003FA16712